jgi:hypothetical protein
MVAACQHCGSVRVLVARVTSTILDQIVCSECALLALRLLSGHDDVHGALTVVPLWDDPYTFQLARS